jgi:hypothetical protein
MTLKNLMEWFSALLMIIALMVFVIGYILNIVQLLSNSYDQVATIIKVVGIFVMPLGAIAGLVG